MAGQHLEWDETFKTLITDYRRTDRQTEFFLALHCYRGLMAYKIYLVSVISDLTVSHGQERPSGLPGLDIMCTRGLVIFFSNMRLATNHRNICEILVGPEFVVVPKAFAGP